MYNYPSKYDEHMIKVRFIKKMPVLDKNYPFRNQSFMGKSLRFTTYMLCYTIGFLLIGLLTGLKIKGRENIKENKKLLKQGAIFICNHVHMWDTICLLKAIRPFKVYLPAWSTNLRGPNGTLIRGIGGIPIPDNYSGLRRFSQTLDEIIKEGKSLHFYPEAAMWFYYDAIRPFKKGAFSLAVKYNKPIIPLVINYRPSKGIYKIFRGKKPSLNINIGKPLLPDYSKGNDCLIDFLNRSREEVKEMSGFLRKIPQS